jgi:hypothetical protein
MVFWTGHLGATKPARREGLLIRPCIGSTALDEELGPISRRAGQVLGSFAAASSNADLV